MATKAAKSITINATKYELANALAVNDGKMQLKAKDVVLDEAELPDGAKYVVFDFGYEGAGFVSCKDQDGNDVLTAADVKDIVYDGGDIYIESSERINGVLTNLRWKATTFHDWIVADEVKFEALFPHFISFWHELTAIGTFADNTPTLSAITPPTLPPSTIKLMTVGIDFGGYGKTDILSYSDVFTGTGANLKINEEKLAAGTVPVIYLVEDSGEDPTTSRGYPETLCPISFAVTLLGDINLNFLGKDLHEALSKAIAKYKQHPNDYNRISIATNYLAGSYAETGHGLVNGIDNIVSVVIAFNVTNGTVAYTSASARLIANQYNRS